MKNTNMSDMDRVMRSAKLFMGLFFLMMFMHRLKVRAEMLAVIAVLLVPVGLRTVFLYGKQIYHELLFWKASRNRS